MKPMLLSNDPVDLDSLDYTNMFMSVKRDGVRAEVVNGELLGRSLKKFRNYKLHKYFENVVEWCKENNVILEGEIYSESVPCRELAGICNSLDYDIPIDTKLHIFGMYDKEKTFRERYEILCRLEVFNLFNIELIIQKRCYNKNDVLSFFSTCSDLGYEGVVLMDGSKRYKEGRVTIKQHIGFKIKPEKEEDLLIVGVNERFINTNESEINELGYKYKRNTVNNKQGTGIAATFTCKMDSGEEVKITITGDENFRKEIWNNRDEYIGRYAVVKYMDYGAKDKLRHPRLVDIKYNIEK